MLGFREKLSRQGTSFDDFAKSKILLPTTELLKAFHELCEPIFRQINQLSKTNVTLIKTRDMLLGRLISGKLPVESLNIQFPPSIQTEQEVAHA